jgi:hypothetical protein
MKKSNRYKTSKTDAPCLIAARKYNDGYLNHLVHAYNQGGEADVMSEAKRLELSLWPCEIKLTASNCLMVAAIRYWYNKEVAAAVIRALQEGGEALANAEIAKYENRTCTDLVKAYAIREKE